METKHIIVIVAIIAVLIILCGVFAFGFTNQNKDALKISDIDVVKDQYGIYSLKGHISPLKDFGYLEARIVFYDDSGVVIGKAPCAWNMLDIKAGSNISVGNGMGAVCDGNPSYAVVSFYDDVRSDNPIVNATVHFSDNKTANSTEKTVSTGSSNNAVVKNDNDDNKKFTQEDMNRAREDGYWNGYSDSYQDQYQYSDDSSVETTTDSSSSSSSSSSRSSSSSSNVETTRG